MLGDALAEVAAARARPGQLNVAVRSTLAPGAASSWPSGLLVAPLRFNAPGEAFAARGGILDIFNTFSGGSLSRMSIIALGVMPYITASIVVQLATTKEDADTFFDVSVRGTFNILEACRRESVKQFILFGGDAAQGIWFYPQPIPIDENHPLTAYPGYYAFSKVMEETMAERARQLGSEFTMKRFFDEVNTVGMIPVSMVYWELDRKSVV